MVLCLKQETCPTWIEKMPSTKTVCSGSHKTSGSVRRRLVKVRLSFTLNTSLPVFTWMGTSAAPGINGGSSLTLRSGCCRDGHGRDVARYCRLSSHKSVKRRRETLSWGPVPFLLSRSKTGDTFWGCGWAERRKKNSPLKCLSVQRTISSSRVHARSVLPLAVKVQKKLVRWHEGHFYQSFEALEGIAG